MSEEKEKNENELEALQKQCEEYLTGWKRALADYDNLKKDLAKEKTAMREQACMQMAMSLIPVLDNFDAATKFAPPAADDKAKNWLQGILFVRNQLEDVMKGLGLEPFGAVGDTFDPNLHESVGGEGEKVSEVISRGWKMGERIVRPAKVIIVK